MKSKICDEKDNDEKEKIDRYIMNFEVSLANMEKVGVAFLVAGYSNYIYAANLDILDAQDRNNTGQTSEETFLFSQKLVLLGYILLWIVASGRVNIKDVSNIYRGENNDLVAYQNVANSYLISVFANLLRLEAFNKLNEDEIQERKNEEEDKENK
ncbi:hypothetical protein [Paraclostridium bifermentans]|jgi:hypothetical protein|uniref:hypothetical protein n=1 Tax=Paraclostridium bifermentans TaxID=1490 RepID=UPI0011DD8D7B|nr:hypothetical protein [Paraclostridium bifermentans]